jgi:hypothetical protein
MKQAMPTGQITRALPEKVTLRTRIVPICHVPGIAPPYTNSMIVSMAGCLLPLTSASTPPGYKNFDPLAKQPFTLAMIGRI